MLRNYRTKEITLRAKREVLSLQPRTIYLLSLISFLALILTLRIFMRPLGQDEGVFLTIGQGMAKGFLPYRDFFDHKPPGIYCLIFAIYHLFGNNVVGYKIVLLLTQLISTWLVFKISGLIINDQFSTIRRCPITNNRKINVIPSPLSSFRINSIEGFFHRLSSRPIEKLFQNGNNTTIQQYSNSVLWAPIFFLFLSIIFEGERFIAEPFVAFCLLASVFLYLRCDCERNEMKHGNLYRDCFVVPPRNDKQNRVSTVHADRRIRELTLGLLSGLFLGLAILFKQTALLSLLAFYLYLISRRDWKALLLIIAGMIIPLGLSQIYLSVHHLLPQAYQQIILYNFKNYPSEPLLSVVIQLLPPFLYTLPVWLLFLVQTKRELHQLIFKPKPKTQNPKYSSLLFIYALAALPMLAYFNRHYPHYWLQSVPFVAILTAGQLKHKLRITNNAFKITLAWILIVSLILTIQFVRFNYPKLQDEQHIASYLQAKKQCVYTENQFIPFYFIAMKHPPNKYLYLTEITESSEDSIQKTLETLKSSDCLIVWPTDLNYAYARELQSYITTNYRPIYWTRSLGAVVYDRVNNE